MAIFRDKLESLNDLLIHQIEDLYDAEKRQIDAIPKLIDAASDPDLEKVLQGQLKEAKSHVSQLEKVFHELDHSPERETCKAMKGLIFEAEDMGKKKGDPAVRDAGLIASLQRIKHYEIAGYGSARSFAHQLGLASVAPLLQGILDQEGHADQNLSEIASRAVNKKTSAAAST